MGSDVKQLEKARDVSLPHVLERTMKAFVLLKSEKAKPLLSGFSSLKPLVDVYVSCYY